MRVYEHVHGVLHTTIRLASVTHITRNSEKPNKVVVHFAGPDTVVLVETDEKAARRLYDELAVAMGTED